MCVGLLRFFLLRHHTEGDLGNRHIQCFFHGGICIHTHRAIASVDVHERIDIVYEAEGLTGYLAVGRIAQRDLLAGIDLLLEMLRHLNKVISKGEVKYIVDGLFGRSRIVFDRSVFIDQFFDSCRELASVIIAEQHAEILVIGGFYARGLLVLVDNIRRGGNHRYCVDHHNEHRDYDRDFICFYEFEEILIKLHTFLSLISGSRPSGTVPLPDRS